MADDTKALQNYVPEQTEIAEKPQTETASTALAAQAKALVEARYIVALKKPRDLAKARQDFLAECGFPSFARVAIYNKPIGKGVTGPSIRFVESAIRCLGNIISDTTAIYDDPDRRIVRVSVCDLETNVSYYQDITVTKTVERRFAKEGEYLSTRPNSGGGITYIVPATDDDIINKQNALISKAVRTLGLRLIPGSLIEDGKDKVAQVLREADKKDPDAAMNAIFDSFYDVGVTVGQIIEYLGHDAKVLSPKELKDLRGYYAAIRDGETTWLEIMENIGKGKADPKPTTGAAGLKATLTKDKKKPVTPKDDSLADALDKLIKAYEAIEILNQDEQEADFARRTGGTTLEDATVAEIEAVVAAINAEFDNLNA